MEWRGETTEMFWDRVTEWHGAYALFPVQLQDGTWLWLQHYERRSLRKGPTILDIEWCNRRIGSTP